MYLSKRWWRCISHIGPMMVSKWTLLTPIRARVHLARCLSRFPTPFGKFEIFMSVNVLSTFLKMWKKACFIGVFSKICFSKFFAKLPCICMEGDPCFCARDWEHSIWGLQHWKKNWKYFSDDRDMVDLLKSFSGAFMLFLGAVFGLFCYVGRPGHVHINVPNDQ